jgi:long-chain fatty acid transport protein
VCSSDLFIPEAVASYEGNAAGPDASYKSDGRGFYAIPQAGMTRRLSDRWAIGATFLSAGLGPDYDGSPYERFGGARRSHLNLASTSLVTELAYRIAPAHTVGVGLNLGYQVLSVEGLEFVANEASSVAPRHVTNQGKDGAFNAGFSVGWHAQYTPWLAAGAAYRSKNLTQRHEDYRGLIAEGGKLELPAIYGGGFTLTPGAGWTISLEAQRYAYRKQRAFRNGLNRFATSPLGSDNGPGFGFNDQNAYKLGVRWQAHPRLALRAGYIRATQIVDENETFFGAFGCVTPTTQYSAGATWTVRDWEVSGYGFNSPKREVDGENSIPDLLGGGEASVSDKVFGFGFSLGRRF